MILHALKKYGMILADNGSDNFISGAPDPRWDMDALRQLKRVTTKDLEVVEMKGMVTDQAATIAPGSGHPKRRAITRAWPTGFPSSIPTTRST